MKKLVVFLCVLVFATSCSSYSKITWEVTENNNDIILYEINQKVVKKRKAVSVVKWYFISSTIQNRKSKDYSEFIDIEFTLKVDSTNQVLEIEFSEKLVNELTENYRVELHEIFEDVNQKNGYGEPLSKSKEEQLLKKYRENLSNKNKFNDNLKTRLNFKHKKLDIY